MMEKGETQGMVGQPNGVFAGAPSNTMEDHAAIALERAADALFPYSGTFATGSGNLSAGKLEAFDPLKHAEQQAARQTSPFVYMAIRESAKQLAKIILSKVKPGKLRDAAIQGLQMVVALCDAALAG